MTGLDHVQDKNGTIQHRLLQLYPAPDFVKTATATQLNGDTSEPLPSHVYGDPVKRVYPCHTKAATWMSALFFGDTAESLPADTAKRIELQIKKAAAFFGIADDVDQLFTKMAGDRHVDTEKLADDAFAFVWEDDNGSKVRAYPLRNQAEITKAASWFNEHGQEFEFADRHTVATRILQKAASYGVVLDDVEKLDQSAGFGMCSVRDAQQAWRLRAAVVRPSHADHAELAMKMAAALDADTVHTLDRQMLLDMAAAMDTFDQVTGLRAKYASVGLTAPEASLFWVTQKVASKLQTELVHTLTGRVYEKVALQQLNVSQIRDVLGDDIASDIGDDILDIDKLADVVATLPRPDAALFDQLAQSVGIKPVTHSKEAGDALTDEELLAYAAEYQGV